MIQLIWLCGIAVPACWIASAAAWARAGTLAGRARWRVSSSPGRAPACSRRDRRRACPDVSGAGHRDDVAHEQRHLDDPEQHHGEQRRQQRCLDCDGPPAITKSGHDNSFPRCEGDRGPSRGKTGDGKTGGAAPGFAICLLMATSRGACDPAWYRPDGPIGPDHWSSWVVLHHRRVRSSSSLAKDPAQTRHRAAGPLLSSQRSEGCACSEGCNASPDASTTHGVLIEMHPFAGTDRRGRVRPAPVPRRPSHTVVAGLSHPAGRSRALHRRDCAS